MTDAYRTAGFVCPSCPDAPLREFGTRLVCDSCEGILLSVEDFASQVHTGEVRVVDDGGATRPCPRCLRPMRGCVLVVGERHLDTPLVRCERDGIWFGDGSLQEVYEEIGSGGMASEGGRDDAGFGAMYGGPEGRRAFVRFPRKLPPREHSPPVPPSALGDRYLACPTRGCGGSELRFEVSRWVCHGCQGLFVENAALEALIGAMGSRPWELPRVTGALGERRCPACAAALTVEQLEGVTVDRCAEHGVWFDKAELEAVLQHVVGVDGSSEQVSWWRRLVSRD